MLWSTQARAVRCIQEPSPYMYMYRYTRPRIHTYIHTYTHTRRYLANEKESKKGRKRLVNWLEPSEENNPWMAFIQTDVRPLASRVLRDRRARLYVIRMRNAMLSSPLPPPPPPPQLFSRAKAATKRLTANQPSRGTVDGILTVPVWVGLSCPVLSSVYKPPPHPPRSPFSSATQITITTITLFTSPLDCQTDRLLSHSAFRLIFYLSLQSIFRTSWYVVFLVIHPSIHSFIQSI